MEKLSKMTKEEKEKILGKLAELIGHYNRDITVPYALSLVEDMVQDMPITEPRETNLEHYQNEIKALIIKQKLILSSALEVVHYNHTGKSYNSINVLGWLVQPYDKPKYKLTQVEYDILDTLFDKMARFKKAYKTDELKSRGYFKYIQCDDNTRVRDILENCEVEGNEH